MAFTTKSRGSQGVSQSGCILGPGRSIIVPSDDWCIVGSSSPRARIQTKFFSTNVRPLSARRRRRVEVPARSFSNSAGESSIISTSV